MAADLKPDFFGLTDRGRVRQENEDQFLCAELTKSMLVHQTSLAIEDSTRLSARRPGYLFLVADGLGGAPAGERASQLAVRSVVRQVLGTIPWFFRLEDNEGDLEDELRRVMEQCQLKIEADVAENPSRTGMGTTLTMAYVIWPRLYVVHVGDARAYLLRGSRFAQITQDHTVAASLPGGTPAGRTPFRKVLWNVIGGETAEVWPDVYTLTLQERDVLLLSTDGLSGQVPEAEIKSHLESSPTSREACTNLVETANRNGGKDNVTVVVARFGSHGPPRSDTATLSAEATLSEENTLATPETEPETPTRGQ